MTFCRNRALNAIFLIHVVVVVEKSYLILMFPQRNVKASELGLGFIWGIVHSLPLPMLNWCMSWESRRCKFFQHAL